MNDQAIIEDLAYQPWSSARELAEKPGVEEQAMRRKLSSLTKRELIVSAKLGMTQRARDRFILTEKGVLSRFDTSHLHPSVGAVRRARAAAPMDPAGETVAKFRDRYDLSHEHSPFGEDRRHEHAPWTATESGARIILPRLGLAEWVYRHGPDLLNTGILRPIKAPTGFVSPGLTRLRWLSKGGLYHCIGEYGPDVWVAFTWVGPHVTERILREKIQTRYWGLLALKADEQVGAATEFQPEPSAHVVVAIDAVAARLAKRVFGRQEHTAIVTVGKPGPRENTVATYRVSRDRLGDPVAPGKVGDAKVLVDALAKMEVPVPAYGAPEYRLFCQVFETVGMDGTQLADVARVSRGIARSILQRFESRGLLRMLDGGYYPDQEGFRAAAAISRVGVATVRSRFGCFLVDEYRRAQKSHNEGLAELVCHFAKSGIPIFGGWRDEINVPGLTQLKPDGLVEVGDENGSVFFAVEYERSAKGDKRVWKKLSPYRKLVEEGRRVLVLFVLDSERAERQFLAQSNGLPLWTNTLTRVTGASAAEGEWVRFDGYAMTIPFRTVHHQGP